MNKFPQYTVKEAVAETKTWHSSGRMSRDWLGRGECARPSRSGPRLFLVFIFSCGRRERRVPPVAMATCPPLSTASPPPDSRRTQPSAQHAAGKAMHRDLDDGAQVSYLDGCTILFHFDITTL